MVRVKRGTTVKKRHKKVIAQAKGYRGVRGNVFSHAKIAVMKAGTNAYRDRRRKKRDFRRLWNVRINGAVREMGLRYSQFINMLYKQKIGLNRKVLSNMTIAYPEVFENVVKAAKGELKSAPAKKAAPKKTTTEAAEKKAPAKKPAAKKPAAKKAPAKK